MVGYDEANMSVLLDFVVATSMAMAGPVPVEADIAWVAKGGFCEPETVLALPDSTLLVSNVCDFRQPGNGYLSLLNAQGEAIDWRVLEGLDAPLGMAMQGDRLYLIDNNRLKTFSWPGYQLLESVNLETSVANDLAVSPEGIIYVSDTDKHQVIRLSTDGSQSVLTGKAQFKNANGMAYENGQLYIGGEQLWRVDLLDNSVETIGPELLTDIDGIEFEQDGTLQVTPVGGPLIRYRDADDVETISGPGISSANHCFAPDLGLAIIPTGFDNTVIAIRVSTL